MLQRNRIAICSSAGASRAKHHPETFTLYDFCADGIGLGHSNFLFNSTGATLDGGASGTVSS